jgi:membrane protein
VIALVRLTIKRAREIRLAQAAGSLAFATTLSLAPLLAVSFALFTRFPIFRRFEDAIEQILLKSLMPADISRTVLRTLNRFAENASGLTLVGMLFALLTAVAMLLTIENALNQIWEVRKPRPLLKRVGVYLALLALGPPLVGASLWASSALMAASLGAIGPLPPALKIVLDLAPLLFGTLVCAAVFHLVPNTRVRRRHALLGGSIASLAFEGGKRGFAAYLLKLPTYKTVYGALAVLPLFLLWVYFSWLVLLSAALVTANLGRAGAGGPRRRGA